jgi:ABC-2 type transport system permease protein
MNKFWRIAVYEYRRNVLKKSFIMVLLSLPLMIALSLGFGMFLESLQDNPQPVGYVDQVGVFAGRIPPPAAGAKEPVEFQSFPSWEVARTALEANEIQAFYVLGVDYHETREIELVYTKKPAANAARQFYDFLQMNLLADQPVEIASRIAIGTDVTVRTPDGKRSVPTGGPSFGLMMPLFINLAFLALLLISSGYLMGAVAEEKENRTMEILVTSVSPMELIGGKIAGIVAIGLTLLLTWSAIAVLGIFISLRLGIGWFQNPSMDWNIILATAVISIPAYVLVSALMTGIGAMASTTQEGQSISSLFIILHMIPLYVGAAFLNHPNGPLAVTMSFLPFTALMTMAMRNLFTAVPLWQAAVSAAIQAACALGALWLASRAFRLGMLRYGQRLSWRRLFQPTQSRSVRESHE